MLLQELSVLNSRGNTLALPIEDISSGFIVKGIEGLGPVKATLVSSSFASMDGAQYHSSRREPRNIVVKLGLDPDYGISSVHEIRSQLYSFFMPKTEAKLTFKMFDKYSENFLTQYMSLDIWGRIESCDPDVFSKDPTLDVSIMCYQPDFVLPESVIFEGMTTDTLDESLIDYPGTVETGVKFTLLPDRVMNQFTLYHRTPSDELRTVTFNESMVAGDELVINSVRGDKYVTLTRAGIQSSVLHGLSPQSPWIELFPGANNIRVYETGVPVPYSIEYTTKFGGL